MTVAEINALTLNDVFWEIFNRLEVDTSAVPEGDELFTLHDDESLAMYDRVTLHALVAKPSLAVFESELAQYKSERVAETQEKERVQDLKTRFKNLKDRSASFHSLYSEPNPAIWFKQLLNLDSAEAESKMAALEAKDAEVETEKNNKQVAKQAKKDVQEAFKTKANADITLEEAVEVIKTLLG